MHRMFGVSAIVSILLLVSIPASAAEESNQNAIPRFFTMYNSDPGNRGQSSTKSISTQAQLPNALPRAASVQPSPMTGKEKWNYYLRSTYGPKSFVFTALGTGIKQAQGSVPEWGGGMEGYGRRYASAFGQKIINRSIRIGLHGLLNEDPRYFASGRSGLWTRTAYAVGQTFIAHKDSGGTRFAYSRFAGDFGGAYLSRQWHPDRYHTTGEYLQTGAISIGIDAAKNVFSEFWPDIRKRLPF